MLHQFKFAVESFFAWLEKIARQLARSVSKLRCPRCGGPLHQGNYLRKPRGAGQTEPAPQKVQREVPETRFTHQERM